MRHIRKGAVLLDPMCGSGTVLQAGLRKGLRVVGFDTDPLAVLMTRVSLRFLSEHRLVYAAERVFRRAIQRKAAFKEPKPWAAIMDSEAADYVEFWFDKPNRLELTALAIEIRAVKNRSVREALWIAFSNMIVVKKNGVSRAMDVAHSRPHRSYKRAPVRAFKVFPASVKGLAKVVSVIPKAGKSRVERGDARTIKIPSNSIDFVLTSPPYFNAIDYVRGHRLSLVWMGYSLEELRALRTENIGSERSDVGLAIERPSIVREIAGRAMSGQKPEPRLRAMVEKYVHDMWTSVGQVAAGMKPNGRVTYVTGDCLSGGVYISNERIIRECATGHGLRPLRTSYREIPSNNRYLPPPASVGKNHLSKRIHKESVAVFAKRPQCRPTGNSDYARPRTMT